jgi:hypothetical protein
VALTGRVNDPLPMDLRAPPPFEVQLDAMLDNPRAADPARATYLHRDVQGSGRLGMHMGLRLRGRDRLRLEGRLDARHFQLWAGPDLGQVQGDASRIHLKDLDGELPFSQEVVLAYPRWWLPRPARTILDSRAASVLYEILRPYAGRKASLALGGAVLDERLGGTRRQLRVDRATLDMALADNALLMRRLYLKLFGGDIAGQVEVQVVSLLPLDLVFRLRTVVTGVNLAYLDPEVEKPTDETEVSAMLDLRLRPARELVEGRVYITRLSLEMLDSLLAYIDPNKQNASVQSNRQLLNAWYTQWINPRVKLVSIWISHGNLNMDIELDAWFVAGMVLKRALKGMRIRRVNVLPLMRQHLRPVLRGIERQLEGMGQQGGRKVAGGGGQAG